MSTDTEEDGKGNTYMNFNAETAGGYNEEVMFMKDDEETFLLLISWDELMIAFKHEF